jgi:hypothetical protein
MYDLRENAQRTFQEVADFLWLLMYADSVSYCYILNDYCQNRGQHRYFVQQTVICKVCYLPHVMKDTIKTKHMTGLVDKAIAKFNQDELCRYEKLFNTVTTHSYLKFKLKMVFVWAAVFRQGCLC